jgi:hypothetical protein
MCVYAMDEECAGPIFLLSLVYLLPELRLLETLEQTYQFSFSVFLFNAYRKEA